MKRIAIVLIALCSLLSFQFNIPAFAGNSIWDILGSGSDSGSSYACASCGTENQPGAQYCSRCGRALEQRSGYSDSFKQRCPGCGHKTNVDPSSCMTVCPSCGNYNNPGVTYCGRCGASVSAGSYVVQCGKCGRQFTCGQQHGGGSYGTTYCSSCGNSYPSSYSSCPRCSGGKTGSSAPAFGGQINLGSFTKASYESEVQRYSIGSYTSNRSFSTITINVSINEKHAPIVNTIQVHRGGSWTPYTQGRRLNAGSNSLSVNIPQGADQIAISLDHGRGASCTVSME